MEANISDIPELEQKLIVVPIDNTVLERARACEAFMPYDSRPLSCTETSFRTLGLNTEATFQQYAVAQTVKATSGSRKIEEIETELKRCADNIEAKMVTTKNIGTIMEHIPLNTATLIFGVRQPTLKMREDGSLFYEQTNGHTFLIARTNSDNIIILNPSGPDPLIEGREANEYISQFISCFVLVSDLPKDEIKSYTITKTPRGGKKTRTKSKRTKSKRTKSKRTKSKRTKSKRTKSKRTKSKRTKHN